MAQADGEEFRFRGEIVSSISTSEIIKRSYPGVDARDDSFYAAPEISLKPCFDEPEYHDVIYSRIARSEDAPIRRDALLKLDLGLAPPLQLPLTSDEATSTTKIDTEMFARGISDILGLPVNVTVSEDGMGLSYTCAEAGINLSSSDVISCLLKNRELGALLLPGASDAPPPPPAADHSSTEREGSRGVSADRAATARAILSRCDPNFAVAASELAHLHQRRGPPQSVDAGLPLALFEWSTVTMPPQDQSFDSPLLISDRMLVRLLRRAGAALEDPAVFPVMRRHLSEFLTDILRTLPLQLSINPESPAVWITSEIVHHSLRAASRDVYGHGGVAGVRHALAPDIMAVLASIHPGAKLSGASLSVLHDMIVDAIDKLVRVGLTYDYCVSAQGAVSELAAGPKNKKTGQHESDRTVTVVVEAHQVPPDVVVGPIPPRTLNVQAITYAVKQTMTQTLAQHAVSEGNHCFRTLTRQGYSDLLSPGAAASLESRCGLNLSVAYIALVAKKLHDVTLTVEGAIHLTAACQFLTSEILELSGNVDYGRATITPRAIMLAVFNDMELKSFFPNPIAGSGSVSAMHMGVVNAQNMLPSDGDGTAETEEDVERYLYGLSKSSFEYKLLKKLGPIGGAMVDPRTGRHYALAPAIGKVHVPEYDAACAMDAETRAAAATALLTPDERGAMDLSKASLKHCFVDRILEIRQLQGDDCTACFDAVKFSIGVYQLLTSKLFPRFPPNMCCLLTAEALLHLRDATEAYMLSVVSAGVLAMAMNGRKIFDGNDFALALRMRR